jgi:hypothetical protein
LTLLVVKQETIEHARFRALSQLIIDKDKGIEAFEEYMKIAFPYLEATKRKEKTDHIKLLQNEIGRGALTVRPVQSPTYKSRVASARARTAPQSQAEERRIYRRMGRAI